jgi:hypothetical protein
MLEIVDHKIVFAKSLVSYLIELFQALGLFKCEEKYWHFALYLKGFANLT